MGYYILIHGRNGASFLNDKLYCEGLSRIRHLSATCDAIYRYFRDNELPYRSDWLNAVISGQIHEIRKLISAEIERFFDASHTPRFIRLSKRCIGDGIYEEIAPQIHDLYTRYANSRADLPVHAVDIHVNEAGVRIEEDEIIGRLLDAYTLRPHLHSLGSFYKNIDFFEGRVDCYVLLWLLSSYADDDGNVTMAIEDLSTRSFLPAPYIIDRLNELEGANFLKKWYKGSRKHRGLSLSTYEVHIPNHKDYYNDPNNEGGESNDDEPSKTAE